MLGEHLQTNAPSDTEAMFPMARETTESSPDGTESRVTDCRAANTRHTLNTDVILRPASTSARDSEEISGSCRNVSQSGCGLVARRAPRVGDVYRFETPDHSSHPLDGINARCVRCHLLDENSFDAGFAFFAPLVIATSAVDDALRQQPLV